MPNRRKFLESAAWTLGGATLASTATAAAAAEPVMSLNVVYPHHEGARFDVDYYRSRHLPLVMQVMKPKSIQLIEGVGNGGAAPPIVLICRIEFASAEALKAALGDPRMAEVRADVANFTDIKPLVTVGRSLPAA